MKNTNNTAKIIGMFVCSAGTGINIISAFSCATNDKLSTAEKVVSVVGHVAGACICENARRVIRNSVINDTISNAVEKEN